MRIFLAALVLVGTTWPLSEATAGESLFIRGDCNQDARIDMGDPIYTLNYLIVQSEAPPTCLDACDLNDDGTVNIVDAIYALHFLSAMGPQPPAPFLECGSDPSADTLGCVGPVAGCVAGNEPPVIVSTPPTSATVSASFTYHVAATDADPGDVLTYSLVIAPTGATIDPATGAIAWTPADSDVGFRRFIVQVSDDSGESSQQDFGVETRYRINCGDAAGPYVDSMGNTWTADFGADGGDTFSTTSPVAGTPDPTIFQSLRFTFDDLFTYSLPIPVDTYQVRLHFAEIFFDMPGERIWDVGLEGAIVLDDFDAVAAAGAGFAATTQEFTQHITDGSVTVDLIDGLEREPTINALEVGVDNQAPAITSVADTTASVGMLYSYDIEASDPNPVDFGSFSLDSAPAGASVDPVSGLIEWTPTARQVGMHLFTVRVTDGGGASATQSFMVDVTP